MFVYTIQPVVKTRCIVYTNIQPVVKPVWQPVWQTAVSCIQPVVKPVVQPGLTTGWTNSGRLNEQWLLIQHGCQTGCQIRLVQPVWQPVVSCTRGFTRQSRSRELNSRPSSCKSNALTARRSSHPVALQKQAVVSVQTYSNILMVFRHAQRTSTSLDMNFLSTWDAED